MWSLEFAVGVVLMLALNLYLITGGADFGGGIWELFARGHRAAAQRTALSHAIGPIWEANHVWLILVVVLLFVCFPSAFAVLGTALHIPLTLMLIGVVLRGSAYVFRAYDVGPSPQAQLWGRVFASSSVLAPLMLGVTLGAVASGTLLVDSNGIVQTDFFSEWLAPFPFAIGLLVLTLCAYLAAVYMGLEDIHDDLKEDFRRRALLSGLGVGLAAWLAFFLARTGAPRLYEGLDFRGYSLLFQLVTGAVSAAALLAVAGRRRRLARALVVAQASLITWGFGFSQYPRLVAPGMTLYNAAAPVEVLRPVLVALGLGSLVLIPSLLWLFSIFKSHRELNPFD